MPHRAGFILLIIFFFVFYIFSLQLLLVLFAEVLLPSQILGKPLESRDRSGSGSDRTLQGTSNAVNGTSGTREKRDSTNDSEYLKSYCKKYQCSGSQCSSSDPCEKGRYMCRGFPEVACKEEPEDFIQSPGWKCVRNIPKYGFQKCFPIYGKWVTLDGKRVRQTTSCGCHEN